MNDTALAEEEAVAVEETTIDLAPAPESEAATEVAAPIAPSGLAEAVKSFEKARTETKGEVIESDEFVDAIFRAYAARTHVYVHGDGGVGKTFAGEIIGKHFDVPVFYAQMRPDMKREELFGPLSMRALQHDEYRHVVQGYMPEAVIANIDELMDAGRFLRQMLSILNERWFVNGNNRLDVPLRTCVGMTNQPLDDSNPHLEALLDRFPQRLEQKPVKTSRGFKKILEQGLAADVDRANGVDRATAYHKVSPAEIAAVTNAVLTCTVGKHILQLVDDLRKESVKEFKSTRSPRRWLEGLRNVKAEAVLNGRDHVVETDLKVLRLMLPNHVDEYKVANDLCANFRDKTTAAIEEATKAIDEIRKALAPQREALENGGTADFAILSEVSRQANELSAKVAEYKANGADASRLTDIEKAIDDEKAFMKRAVIGG